MTSIHVTHTLVLSVIFNVNYCKNLQFKLHFRLDALLLNRSHEHVIKMGGVNIYAELLSCVEFLGDWRMRMLGALVSRTALRSWRQMFSFFFFLLMWFTPSGGWEPRLC